jgi:4-amino-4-deoxy-L-arabinose transferase-like glycosyltransferase
MCLCFRLGYLPLLEPDEERNAEVAREMKLSGQWLVPTYDGITYLDKPAFYFKAVSMSLAALGDNETAARIPSALFGIALVIMVFLFCRKVFGTRCGLLAMILVATTPLYLALARIVIFDMALTFFVCGAIFAGYLGESSGGDARRKWLALGAASAGFATLVKGPVGFLVPLLVLILFNWIEGRRDAWKRLLAPVNLLVFFGITLPWFVGLCLAHRDFFYYGLVEESFHRFTSAKTFHRAEPVYFYLLIVAGTFFPWSVFLPGAGVAMWKERWLKHSAADRLCVVWSVAVVVFFSISRSKMPGYILSVAVAFGILIARVCDAALSSATGKPGRLVVRATGVFAVVCLGMAFAAVAGALDHMHALAGLMSLEPEDARRLTRQVLPMAIVLLVFSVCGFVAHYRRSAGFGLLCLALFVPVGIFSNIGALEVFYDAKSGRRMADQLAALPPQTQLACVECFPTSLPVYLHRTVTLISRDGRELTSNYIIYSLKKESVWPRQIVPLEDMDQWLTSQKTAVTLIVRERRGTEFKKIAADRNGTIQPLSPGYLVVQLPAPRGP